MRTSKESKDLIESVVRGIHLPEVLTLSDLERYLSLPAPFIGQELASGRLRGRRIGADWRVHRDEVRAWLTRPEEGGDGAS